MPSPPGPLLPRRRLGAELKRLRGTLTLEEVAVETLISTSKLSRLENGQGVPQQRDIRDLINFYNADRPTAERLRRWMNEGRRQAWWKEFSDVVPESFDPFLDYEAGASVIRSYAPMVLPGLLQTRTYAKQLLTTVLPHRTPEQIDKLVQVRLRRQQILLDEAESETRLLTVIDEAAITRALATGSVEEGRAQLVHLREVSRLKRISVRILPLHAGLHPGVLGAFNIYQFSDDIDRDIVLVEARSGDRYLEEQSSVLDHLRLFDAVNGRALDNSDSRDLLTQLVEAPHPQEKK